MRFRIRFSVRTLAVFVALVCALLETWQATKRLACHKVQRHIESSGKLVAKIESPYPFVVVVTEVELGENPEQATIAFNEIELVPPLTPGYPRTIAGAVQLNRHSYLYVFRWIYRLNSAPLETDVIELNSETPPHGLKTIKSDQVWDGKGP